jgi:SpoIIAA-like
MDDSSPRRSADAGVAPARFRTVGAVPQRREAKMIKLLTDLPEGVVGIEAVGHVEADDYTGVVEPAVRAALEHTDKLRLLYVLGEEFDGYSAAASWEDAKLGIGHWSAWEKIAVVTDRGWLRDGIKAFGWMFPGEVKIFSTSEREDARAWSSA